MGSIPTPFFWSLLHYIGGRGKCWVGSGGGNISDGELRVGFEASTVVAVQAGLGYDLRAVERAERGAS